MQTEMFEKVYVINLERRPERLKTFFERLPTDWPFQIPKRYEAIDGEISLPPRWWKEGNGAWGCYRTHLSIIEKCLNRGIDSVLIMEDDAVCVNDFRSNVNQFLNHLPDDWTMVYFGGQHIQENLRLPRKINDWVYAPYNVNRTHCYAVRGRLMLESVYRHLHDYTSWNVSHHVDHYLGELHKTMEHGLYVPREWMVAQAEGTSDITRNRQKYRIFPGAEETVFPTIDMPCIAILGSWFSGGNTIAGVLRQLGFSLGTGLDQVKTNPESLEEPGLKEICRHCYSEPWLEDQLPYEDRVNLLRYWAGQQCHQQRQVFDGLCGTYPLLSLMGSELLEAWNQPKFIIVERLYEECHRVMKRMPWCWHPRGVKYAFERLNQAQESLVNTGDSTRILQLNYEQIIGQSDTTVVQLCGFLKLRPTSEQYQNAVHWIQTSEDDVTFSFE